MIVKFIRWFVGGIILFWDRTFVPTGVKRPEERQAVIDSETKDLILYQFPSCPFCVKVRRAMQRMSLNIELRDPRGDEKSHQELMEGGGKMQAPCLRIEENGEVRWMYESNDIIAYLESRFAA